MHTFTGFPAGRLKATPVPELFFTDLLPQVDNLAELKVVLHCMWLLAGEGGQMRYVRADELARDRMFLRALENLHPDGAEAALREALDQATSRGVLLRARVRRGAATQEWYFLNSETGREAQQRLRRGELGDLYEVLPDEARVQVERPNIFVLYEQNIGTLQPLIAEELRDAERTYPPEWIEEAFREAAGRNKRSWRYILRILERWAEEGKGRDGADQRDVEEDRRRYIRGHYADVIQY